jgi:hypothetical protein
MMILRSSSSRRGMTLVELAISSAIMAMIMVGVMAAVLTVARYERNALIKEGVLSHARQIEASLQRILRHKSRDRITYIGFNPGAFDFVPRILFREDETAPEEELRFADGQLIHDPDTSVADNERVIGGRGAAGSAFCRLVEAGFRPALKPDSSNIEAGMIQVRIRVDDNGQIRHRETLAQGAQPYGLDKWIAIQARGTQ